MARRLTDTVRGEGGAVDDAIQQAGQTYTNALGQKTTQYDPNSVKTVTEAEAKAQGSFQGPTSWEEAGIDTVGLAGKAAAASDKAKSLTSDYGRAALLRAQAQGPYTAGMSGLDAALAGAAGGNAFQETANMYGGLSAKLQAARGGAGSAYEKAAATHAENQAKYGKRAGEIRAGTAAEQLAAQQAERDAQAQAEADAAGGGTGNKRGTNARDVAEEKRRRARPEFGTNMTGRVGRGRGTAEDRAPGYGVLMGGN